MTEQRIRIDRAPTRCPFCHDDAAADGTVACAECLARHHSACWDEGGRCAACGVERRLESLDERRGPEQLASPLRSRALLVLIGITVGLGAAAGTASHANDRLAFFVLPALLGLLVGAVTRRRGLTVAAAVLPCAALSVSWLLHVGPTFTRCIAALATPLLGLPLALPGLAAVWFATRGVQPAAPRRAPPEGAARKERDAGEA